MPAGRERARAPERVPPGLEAGAFGQNAQAIALALAATTAETATCTPVPKLPIIQAMTSRATAVGSRTNAARATNNSRNSGDSSHSDRNSGRQWFGCERFGLRDRVARRGPDFLRPDGVGISLCCPACTGHGSRVSRRDASSATLVARVRRRKTEPPTMAAAQLKWRRGEEGRHSGHLMPAGRACVCLVQPPAIACPGQGRGKPEGRQWATAMARECTTVPQRAGDSAIRLITLRIHPMDHPVPRARLPPPSRPVPSRSSATALLLHAARAPWHADVPVQPVLADWRVCLHSFAQREA